MSADLTLPGEIPGLLRRGSPIVFRAGGMTPGVCARPIDWKGERCWLTWWENGQHGASQPSHPSSVLLDLTDPTGRVHAAWWARAKLLESDRKFWEKDRHLVALACFKEDMADEQIATLRDLVLRLWRAS